jgi:hypothetical protein
LKTFIVKNRAVLAFIILAVVTVLAINASARHVARATASAAAGTLYQGQLASCERNDRLRVQINKRFVQNASKGEQVLVTFLDNAASARLANYNATHLAADKAAADEYARLADIARATVRYEPLQLINCKKVISKP